MNVLLSCRMTLTRCLRWLDILLLRPATILKAGWLEERRDEKGIKNRNGSERDDLNRKRQLCWPTLFWLSFSSAQVGQLSRQSTGKSQFTQTFRQWHYCRQCHRGRATDKKINLEGFTRGQRFLVMNSDSSMYLIVQSNFIGFILIPPELHPIHS